LFLVDEVKLEKVKKPKGVMWLKHLKPILFIFISIFCWEILFLQVMIPPVTPSPNSHIQTKNIGKFFATQKFLVFLDRALQCQKPRRTLPHSYFIINFQQWQWQWCYEPLRHHLSNQPPHFANFPLWHSLVMVQHVNKHIPPN
jgi:hypothetical protein